MEEEAGREGSRAATTTTTTTTTEAQSPPILIRIPTHCFAVDTLTDGGLATGTITQIFGEKALGKSIISFQAACASGRRGVERDNPGHGAVLLQLPDALLEGEHGPTLRKGGQGHGLEGGEGPQEREEEQDRDEGAARSPSSVAPSTGWGWCTPSGTSVPSRTRSRPSST